VAAVCARTATVASVTATESPATSPAACCKAVGSTMTAATWAPPDGFWAASCPCHKPRCLTPKISASTAPKATSASGWSLIRSNRASMPRLSLVVCSTMDVHQLANPEEGINGEPGADDAGGRKPIDDTKPDQAPDPGRHLPDQRRDMPLGAVDNQPADARQ